MGRSVGFQTRTDAYAGLGRTRCDHKRIEPEMIRNATGGSCERDFVFAEAVRRERGCETMQMITSEFPVLGDMPFRSSDFAFAAPPDPPQGWLRYGAGAHELLDARGHGGHW